eukprot:GHVP01028512.1.p1 GENE.GHVP01028512.1~~GHVP01028512.1.p1  ORF type:complete len:218 (-),score=43.70 GHVP01028512.1:39-692(-)
MQELLNLSPLGRTIPLLSARDPMSVESAILVDIGIRASTDLRPVPLERKELSDLAAMALLEGDLFGEKVVESFEERLQFANTHRFVPSNFACHRFVIDTPVSCVLSRLHQLKLRPDILQNSVGVAARAELSGILACVIFAEDKDLTSDEKSEAYAVSRRVLEIQKTKTPFSEFAPPEGTLLMCRTQTVHGELIVPRAPVEWQEYRREWEAVYHPKHK